MSGRRPKRRRVAGPGGGLILLGLLLAGCGGPPASLVPVEGTVVFAGGKVPDAAVATVHFEPVADGPQQIRKVASGTIGPDGRFTLMTRRPDDGVIPGRYRVFFTIEKTFAGRERLVPARYASAEETPFEVTVEPRSNPPFRFEIE
jgi:hypothetical protein